MPQEYETTDLYLTSLLKTKGIACIRTGTKETNKKYWVFYLDEECKGWLLKYRDDEEINLKIKTFIKSIRDLKWEIFNPMDEPNI